MKLSGPVYRLVAAALFLVVAAAYPVADRWLSRQKVQRRIDEIHNGMQARPAADWAFSSDPSLLLRIETLGPLLSSWQTVGGCGAGASASGGVGVKWIGHNVSGGLFNVQTQLNFTRLPATPVSQSHYFLNTLITRDVTQQWTVGANVPWVYKSMPNYLGFGHDITNSGIGDMSLLLTRRLGPINATSLTATVGLPTGVSDARHRTLLLKQNEQTGYGRVTGSLMLDHTLDQTWGLVVLGGVAAYRGGVNEVGNHRVSTASGYAYAGYFLGPFVPAIGLGLSGYTGHDQDLSTEQYTALFSATPSVSLEWSTEWVAFLLGATFPYQYDGFDKNTEGAPRSPWSFSPWTVALGISIAPF